MKQLPLSFFKRDTLLVARELVGKLLQVDDCLLRIVEVEAYKQDAASHAKTRTKRSELMHDTYGHIYVYFIYGMYYCLNITSDTEPGAVLIRALDDPACNGPGKLCKTLSITKEDNGQQLGRRFKILDDEKNFAIEKTPRIGITKDIHLHWRFSIKDHPYLSRKS